MRKWHTTLCEICIRTGSTKQFYYEKWGLYVPERRFDVDQSPMPFAQDTGKTYEIVERASRDKEKRKANIDGKVWCAQPKAGDSKQFCSLNICFRPRRKQPRLAIMFRGKGKRIKEVEKLLWDPDVDVYFQVNARADTEFCVAWAKKTLALIVKEACLNDEPYLLFCDNLEGQIADDFTSAVNSQGGKPWYGIPNPTNIWQPVDRGYASTLKAFISQEFYNWLDDNDHCDFLYGADSKITASEKRILITKWCRNAYRRLNTPKYDPFQWRLFEKTSYLITADGSNNTKINPEGIPNNIVPAPSVLEPAVDHTLSSNVPEEFNQNIFDAFDEYNEEEESDVEVCDYQEGYDLDRGSVFDGERVIDLEYGF